MATTFNALPYGHLQNSTGYERPPQRLPERVTSDSPAIDVMTDLTKVSAITMGPCGTLDDAEQRMIASGVRLLFVINQHNKILGIITTTDLQGERPMKYLQEVGGKREEIFVRDIMTSAEKLDVMYMDAVNGARVGDVVETLKHMGRQHALVVDKDADGKEKVRGIFSTKQISKQLGITIETTEVAKTFAELEAALSA